MPHNIYHSYIVEVCTQRIERSKRSKEGERERDTHIRVSAFQRAIHHMHRCLSGRNRYKAKVATNIVSRECGRHNDNTERVTTYYLSREKVDDS